MAKSCCYYSSSTPAAKLKEIFAERAWTIDSLIDVPRIEACSL
jgi:hypothetical protein